MKMEEQIIEAVRSHYMIPVNRTTWKARHHSSRSKFQNNQLRKWKKKNDVAILTRKRL
jgi:hypothetical protein